MVSRVRGVEQLAARTKAWDAARAALDDGKLAPGWHPLSSIPHAGRTGEALDQPGPRSVRRSGGRRGTARAELRVVSLEDDGLRSLAQGFDHLHPDRRLDGRRAGADAVAGAEGRRRHGRPADHAGHGGSARRRPHHRRAARAAAGPRGVPTCSSPTSTRRVADAARACPPRAAASDRGVRLSASSSAIGALMLIPGVVGRGPASVNAGAAAGLWTGFAAGRRGVPRPGARPRNRGTTGTRCRSTEVRRLLPPPDGATTRKTARTAHDRCSEPPPPGAHARRPDPGGLARDFVGGDACQPGGSDHPDPGDRRGGERPAGLAVRRCPGRRRAAGQRRAVRRAAVTRRTSTAPTARRAGPAGTPAVGTAGRSVATRRCPPTGCVRGDVIEVRSGEVVPADARLIEAVERRSRRIHADRRIAAGGQEHRSHAGCTAGRTRPACSTPAAPWSPVLVLAVVTAVGSASEMRRAMAMAPGKSREIGLQTQLRRITDARVAVVSVGGGALVGTTQLVTSHTAARVRRRQLSVGHRRRGARRLAAGGDAGAAGRRTQAKRRIRTDPQPTLGRSLGPATGGLLRQDRHIERKPVAGQVRSAAEAGSPTPTYSERRQTPYSHRNGHRADHATDDAIRAAADRRICRRTSRVTTRFCRSSPAARSRHRWRARGSPSRARPR